MRRCSGNKPKTNKLSTCALCLCVLAYTKAEHQVVYSASYLLPRNLLSDTSMVPSIYTSSFIN
jgi:hypothetical protein